MPRNYVKPTKSNTGGILEVSFNAKTTNKHGRPDPKFWFNVIRQNGWTNEGPRGGNGIFKDGKKVSVSFNLNEVGDIIRTIEERRTKLEGGGFNFYHSSSKGNTSGSFTYYFIEPDQKVKDSKPKEGYGFSLDQEGEKSKVGLSLGEGRELLEWLKFGLEHCYNAIYSDDKKRAEEFAEKKNDAKTATKTVKMVKPAKKVEKDDAPVTEEQANEELEAEVASIESENGSGQGVNNDDDGVDF